MALSSSSSSSRKMKRSGKQNRGRGRPGGRQDQSIPEPSTTKNTGLLMPIHDPAVQRNSAVVPYTSVAPRTFYQRQPLPVPVCSSLNTVVPYFPQFSNRNYRYPGVDWNSVLPVYGRRPLFTIPVLSPAILPPPLPVVPYYNPLVPCCPILPDPCVSIFSSLSVASPYSPCLAYIDTSPPLLSLADTDASVTLTDEGFQDISATSASSTAETAESFNLRPADPLQSFLTLPKDKFPPAMMLSIDPNPLIDEFCKIRSILEHASWIMDLEFGVPRFPVTRPIATYDAQYNSVHCKNTPQAIHPGFESCPVDFQRAMTFYYDCVVSTWYRGFMEMSDDCSVVKYQSWLRAPMLAFGMCWP